MFWRVLAIFLVAIGLLGLEAGEVIGAQGDSFGRVEEESAAAKVAEGLKGSLGLKRLVVVPVVGEEGGVVTETLVQELVRHEFVVLEREALGRVMAEQRLGLSDLVDPGTAARVGRLMGAEAVLIGQVQKGRAVDSRSYLAVRVVDVGTGQVLWADRVALVAPTGTRWVSLGRKLGLGFLALMVVLGTLVVADRDGSLRRYGVLKPSAVLCFLLGTGLLVVLYVAFFGKAPEFFVVLFRDLGFYG